MVLKLLKMFPTIYNQSFLNPNIPNGMSLGLSSGLPDIDITGKSNLRIPDPPIIEKKGTNFNLI